MHNTIRFVSIALSAVSLTNCSDVAHGTRPSAPQRATFVIAPRFEVGATQTAASLALVGLAFNGVRIVIIRPATDTLADTTVTYQPGDASRTLVIGVLAVPNEPLGVTMQYKSGSTVLFEGTASTTATPLNAPTTSSNTVSITVKYTGPGSTATSIAIVPGSGTYASGVVTQFTAKAFDVGNVELANVPIAWSVNDTTVATITPTGALTPKGLRGTVTVIATLGSLTQTATVNFAPPTQGIRVVQGAAQTGPPGTQLPLPIIVELVAADGLPAAGSGLTATFVANTGGSVTPASAPLNATGRAQASFTLGSNAGGIFLYTATVGTFSTTIPEIAVVGPPTQLIPNGATTITMTAGVVPNPVPGFRVADAFGNSVPTVPLVATIKQGTGQDSIVFIADTIGLGDISRIAANLTLAGTVTVTITTGNAAAPIPALTYTLTVVPAAAAKLAFGVQPIAAKADSVIKPAITVLIQDSFGNTVTSATTAVNILLDPATTSGASMFGTTTVSPVNGVATFSNISLRPAKLGVRLIATSSALPQVVSNAFNINP